MENAFIILTLTIFLETVVLILPRARRFAEKKFGKFLRQRFYYDDGTPPKIFITGDKHRNFAEVKRFCRKMNTRRKDALIILGDAGFNYYEDIRDDKLKARISKLNITLLCIHGNKERRPESIGTYGICSFCGGRVYYEPKYPNIFFAIDGEIYNFDGRKYIVMGGAHSVDKQYCLKTGKPFWNDETPSDEVKKKFEERLNSEGNQIYGIMTHACPIKYLPTEKFKSAKQKEDKKLKKTKREFKPDIDRSTEEWFDDIENKTNYKVWYCGHYHIDKKIDKIHMMHHEIRPLRGKDIGDDDA